MHTSRFQAKGPVDEQHEVERAVTGARAIRPALWRALAPLAAGIALLLAPSGALAASGEAATEQYLQADYRLAHTANSKIPAIEGAIDGVLSQARSTCPLAASGSPEDEQSTELSDEVIGAMVISAVALDRPAGRAFLSAVAHLSWGNRQLTQAVRAYAGKVSTLVGMQPPDLCADVRSWGASGWRTLPATTASFAPRFMAAWVAPGEQPPQLARYENAQERALAGRAARLEQQFSEFEARAVETWAEIMNALDLQP